MHTAPVSWRAEKNRPPAATIAFVTARFPLPIRPNTTSPPRAWTVRPTASETSIGRTLAFGRDADSGVVAGARRPHGGGRVRARPRRALVRDAVRRAAGRARPPRCWRPTGEIKFPRWTFVAAQAVLGVTLGAYLEPDALEAVGGAWLPVALVSAGTLVREHGRRAHPRAPDRARPRDGDARDDRRRRLRHRRDGRRARRRRPARGLHAVHARARRRAAHAAARARLGRRRRRRKRRAKPCSPPGTTGCSPR